MDAGTGLDDARFAVVDIETTGLRTSRHHILQIAVVTVDACGTELDRWSTYVRPQRWPFVRVGARRIHGIRRAQLRGAPPAPVALAQLAERIEGTVLTGHNLAFDAAFLRRDAERHGVRLPAGPELCTLLVSRSLDPDHQLSHRLGDVCRRYGVDHSRPHDALEDAKATSAVLPYLLKDAGITSWERLAAPLPPRRQRNEHRQAS